MSLTIYHNPACGTSRTVLAMIRASGETPHVVVYLDTPPSRPMLRALIAAAGVGVRGALRRKGTPYDELGLDDPALDDEALLTHMLETPILIQRPFVVSPLGTRLCRPSETVLELLPDRSFLPYAREDGTIISA